MSVSDLEEKLERARSILRSMDDVIVAFSGGVDSTLLLRLAQEQVRRRVLAIHAVSSLVPGADTDLVKRIATRLGVELEIIKTDEMDDPCFLDNSPERCYICKKKLFQKMMERGRQKGINLILDGTNADDLSLFRPGRRAAEEAGIRSPLAESGLSKEEVRKAARGMGIETADRPSNACLATRIPFHEKITEEKLEMISEAEAYLRDLGLGQLRVRHHGPIARIEVPVEDLDVLMRNRDDVVRTLKGLGFNYITLDLQGFRSGSLEELLSDSHR